MPVSDLLSTDDEACDPAAVLAAALSPSTGSWGSGLNPLRRPDVLCKDIFELMTTQMRLIAGESNRSTIETLSRSSIAASISKSQQCKSNTTGSSGNGCSDSSQRGRDIKYEIWGSSSDKPGEGGTRCVTEEKYNRGRSHSPANRRSNRSQARQSQSYTPLGTRGPGADSPSPAPPVSRDGGPGIAADRRSRSTSNGPSRRNIMRGGSLGPGKLPPKAGNSSRHSSQGTSGKLQSPSTSPRSMLDGEDDPPDPFETLKCFPAEVQSYLNCHRGPIHGVWLTEHPLSTYPYQYYDMQAYIESFSAASLPDNKRQEWTIDLLREFDDRRMDGLEDYLLSHRKNVDEQMRFATTSSFRSIMKDGVGERGPRSDLSRGRKGEASK